MSDNLPNRLRAAAQYTGLDSMRELLIEAAGALEGVEPVARSKEREDPLTGAGASDPVNAIRGAIAFGAQGVNFPPDGHWLLEFWNIGRAAEQHQERKRITDEQMEAVHEAARRSFIRHKSSIGGQQLTAADSFETHVMLATWAECCKTHGIKD